GVRRHHALAADLATAAHGRRHAFEDRRRHPAFRRPCGPGRRRDGRRGRPRGLPPRRRHLALRQQLPADASRPCRQGAPADDEHRVQRQDALHHRLGERRDRHGRDAGSRQEDVFDEVTMRLVALAALLAASIANAQYPAKPVRVIVGYAAGSSTDIVARVMADRLAAHWKSSVYVETRAGAAGNLAADAVAKSAPDGYTLLFAQNGLASSAAALPNLPYRAQTDLVPLAPVAATPHILIVAPEFPAKNVQQLIARAKAEPGKLSFASSGVGNSDHLCGELFDLMAGISAIHVPYKGDAPAATDVMAGRIA